MVVYDDVWGCIKYVLRVMMVYDGLCWFMLVYVDLWWLWWFMMACDDSWWLMVSDVLWCFLMAYYGLWWWIVAYCDSRWMVYDALWFKMVQWFIVGLWWVVMVRTCLNRVLPSLALLKYVSTGALAIICEQHDAMAKSELGVLRLARSASFWPGKWRGISNPSKHSMTSCHKKRQMISTLASWQPKSQQCHPSILVGE